jgi:hypothetical protein
MNPVLGIPLIHKLRNSIFHGEGKNFTLGSQNVSNKFFTPCRKFFFLVLLETMNRKKNLILDLRAW